MNQNLFAILISYTYVISVLLVSSLINKRVKNNKEISRKFIHIMLGNWVFLYPLFSSLIALMITPLSFVIINYISAKYKLIDAMEREDSNSNGTIFYAVSLSVLCLFAYTMQLPIILYSGMLILAYGDGLAAIFGKSIKSLKINKSKTVVGSLVVFLVSLIISLATNTYFNNINAYVMFASITVSVLAVLLEIIGSNGYDNLTLPIGVSMYNFAFIVNGAHSDFIGVNILLISILYVALKKEALDLKGAILAFLMGLNIYTLGNIYLLLSLLTFFILGSVISKISNEVKSKAEAGQEETGARSYVQVYSNALVSLILVFIYYLSKNEKFLLLAFAAFAVAYSDTFSSELGMLSSGRVISILNFKELPTGVSGGISLMGMLSGILGSLIASLFVLISINLNDAIIVFILGFIGTIVDSILGASIQKTYINDKGDYQDKSENSVRLASGFTFINNSLVNFLSISIVVVIGYFII